MLQQAGSSFATRHRSRRHSLRIWIICSALIVGVVLQSGYAVLSERRAAIAERELDTSNLSIVLAEHASRYLAVVDLVLQTMQARIRDIGVDSEATFRERLAGSETHADMVRRVQMIPGDAALLLFGAEGALVNFSRPGVVPAINAADRDFFAHFRDHDDPNLYIGTPAKSRVTSSWAIFPARRSSSPRWSLPGSDCGCYRCQVSPELLPGGFNVSRSRRYATPNRRNGLGSVSRSPSSVHGHVNA